ncbi:hypothetical protein TVAG_159900 [Trichomonas vaginalis G3]|uniref:CAF1B/HIR1 beta-propeller domain-containing protein n=1 Tax=Trichomonas vaginalis (strain ATCC PRA-98 / G3) TaxID=412133 RepID=A2DUT2_TRIV3|nr:DNA replication-independent nucleosome assembly [Trichomonas vaginalis G3]EAY15817.1 hypothetical protein TVAG_159900 [Trichomonas vaginalis G3]KAI5525012.1 DNA replication-independent nucleosome assembly [Trichomonas vaginalis G3]|eukprot:XP_001328040.1 hypothetical protein [Trichomonas vaginalis G3]
MEEEKNEIETDASLRFVFPKWLGHSSKPVSSIDIHPSGEFFATGGWDNFCKIWALKAISETKHETKTKLLAVLRDHTKPINCVRFSPDGKYLATGGDDGMVFLWQKVRCFGQPSTFGIPDSALQPNHPVQRWQSKSFTGHTGDITGVSWYPDSTKIASCSIDGIIYVWDIKSASKLFQYNTTTKMGVSSISIDPLGKFIAAQLLDGTLDIYDHSTGFHSFFGEQFRQPDQAMVSRICWTPDGSFVGVTSANSGGFVSPFFRRETFAFGFMLEGHVAATCCISCPPYLFRNKNGSYSSLMACGDKGGVISIWMIGDDTKPLVVLDGVSTSTINDMAWTNDGHWLLVALDLNPVNRQGGIVAFDLSNVHNLERVDNESMEEIKSHLLGENSFRVRMNQSTKATQLLHSLETEEKDVNLEVLQLTPEEVLARQVVIVKDGIKHITPVLLTAVERQMISFKMEVESTAIPATSSEYNIPVKPWQKPASIQGIVNKTLDIGDFHLITYSGYLMKLDASTGRRLSTPFYIGDFCRHLSHKDGVILAVGNLCYLIKLSDMTEILRCSAPTNFTGFSLLENNVITAHAKGRHWIYDKDFGEWRGGAVSTDASDLSIEEIESLVSEQNSVQWFDLGATAVFQAFMGQNDKAANIVQELSQHQDQDLSKNFVSSLKQVLENRWNISVD